jgi:subfamily B ATP-binding cassette protein MsbA
MIEPAKKFATAFYNIQKGMAALDRIDEIRNADLRILERKDAKPIQAFQEKIELQNVGFAYANSNRPALEGINLVIAKGKIVALIGTSGAGKSTLADLLPRFHDVSEGKILLDGTDIRDFRLHDLRSLMGIVTQEPVLFNDTIYNNIAFGMKDVTSAAVEQAARIAHAHDFILATPEGYQTNIGDRGVKLSGGQRQRLTIARAVLANPPILILDEATSALDSESEKLVQDALDVLMKNRTSIVIAHRLSTVQHADEIVVMRDGKIIEQGTHEALMQRGGEYGKLVELQSF